jgi:hypothetical protein
MKAYESVVVFSGCRGIGSVECPKCTRRDIGTNMYCTVMVVEQGNESVMVVISFHNGPLC